MARMAADRSLDGRDGRGLYVAVVVVALALAFYLALQLVGFVFKLLFVTAVALVGLAAWRAWRGSS